MQKQQTLSQKDIHQIHQTYKKAIQAYHENACPRTEQVLIRLNRLIVQCIQHQDQFNNMEQIVAKLEMLRVKVRGKGGLREGIQGAIGHFRGKGTATGTGGGQIEMGTIEECLECQELYQVCSMLVQRLYMSKIHKNPSIPTQPLTTALTTHTNPPHLPQTLQTLTEILIHTDPQTLNLPNSNLIPFCHQLLDTHFQYLIKQKDKNSIALGLRILLFVAKSEKGLVWGREGALCEVMWDWGGGIGLVGEIVGLGYDQGYLEEFVKLGDGNQTQSVEQTQLPLKAISPETLDILYIWSLHKQFSKKCTQTHINLLQSNLASQSNPTPQTEHKTYTTIDHIISASPPATPSRPPKHIRYSWHLPHNPVQPVMNSYLELIYTVLQRHAHRADRTELVVSHQFDVRNVEKVCNQGKLFGETTKKLVRGIQRVLAEGKEIVYRKIDLGGLRLKGEATIMIQDKVKGKVNRSPQINKKQSLNKKQKVQTESNLTQLTFENLLQQAKTIPKTPQQLQKALQLLQNPPPTLPTPLIPTQTDTLQSTTLHSITQSILQNHNIHPQQLFNSLTPQSYTPAILKQLLELANLELKLNPGSAQVMDMERLGGLVVELYGEGMGDTVGGLGGLEGVGEILYWWVGKEMGEGSGQEAKVRVLEQLKDSMKKSKSENKQAKINTLEDVVKIIHKIYQDQSENIHESQQINLMKDTTQINIRNNQDVNEPIQYIQQKKDAFKKIKKQESQTIKDIQLKQDQVRNTNKQQSNQVQSKQTQPKKQQTTQLKPQQLPQHNPSPPTPTDPTNPTATLTHTHTLTKNPILKHKITQCLKSWRKRAKKSKLRYHKLKQWYETEKTYKEKLLVLRDGIRNPLLEGKLIREVEAAVIFSNLDAMIVLCQLMVVKLGELLEGWSPVNTMLAPILTPISNCLKIYKDYSLHYQKSHQTLTTLSHTQKYKSLIPPATALSLQNYLFSPVQRFQKYHLFVSEYFHSLPPGHKDQQTLRAAREQLLKVNQEINQFIESRARADRMVELDGRFGNVVAHARVYKVEFLAGLGAGEGKCRVYTFNDLLLVVRVHQSSTSQQLLYRIKLTPNSFTTLQPNCTSFTNRLYICGTDISVHLTFPTMQQARQVHELINRLIDEMYMREYKRNDIISQGKSRLVNSVGGEGDRSTCGTSQEGYSMMMYNERLLMEKNAYHPLQLKFQVLATQKLILKSQLQIYYILHLQTAKPYQIAQTLFANLSTLQRIEKHLNLLYPNLHIPKFEIRNSSVSSEQVTRICEYLCMAVERFVNFVVRNGQISRKPELVVYRLGVHEGVWEYVNRSKNSLQCFCEACEHAEVYDNFSYYYRQKESIHSKSHKFCILNSLLTTHTIANFTTPQQFKTLQIEQRMIWANAKQNRLDYRLLQYPRFGRNMYLKVNVRMVAEVVGIEVRKATIYSTCREIVEEVCQVVGIGTTLDVGLVFVYGKYQIVLDQDQCIADIAQVLAQEQLLQQKRQQRQSESRFSIWQRLSISNSGSNKNSQVVQLYLRKLFIFDSQLQERSCESNPERYQFIVGEILRKFKEQTLLLNTEDTRLLCALVYCVENFSTLIVEQKKVLREQKFKKYLPESKYNMITPDFIEKAHHIIVNQIQVANKQEVLYKSILKTFATKFTWQCQYFRIQNTQKSLLLGNFKHLLIGVSHKKVVIANEKSSGNLLQYPVTHFKYRIYGDSLYVDSEEMTHRFTGPNLYVLARMIEVYKLIHQFETQE